MPTSPSGNSIRRSPRGKSQQRRDSSLPKKKAGGNRKKSVAKKNARKKSKVNTAVAKNSKINRIRSRNSESAGDKPCKRGERGLKRTAASEEVQHTETSDASAKRSRRQSGAARRHHDAEEHNSIENSFSSASSEEEASIHDTDDDEDKRDTDSVDREAAAWEEGSDIECETGNNRAQSSFSRTAFSDALEREKENAVEQVVESSPSNAAGRVASQLRNGVAFSHADGGIHRTSHTAMEASLSNANPGQQHGGRTEALAMDLDDVTAGLRGLTRKESMEKRQPHVADRVRIFVKSVIFRRIKFVNSDQMSLRALQLVMDHENVPARNREKFYMLYDSVFNEALNTKRSSCEQAAGRIVRESIAQLENPDDFFTIEELCKLRRATTERERNAFFWFFGTFMDSVSGRRYWGKQKYKQLVSTACEKGGESKLVTRSDEAFALLLFENYIDKWKTKTVATPAPETDGAEQAGESNKRSKLRGKFTGKKSGHCKYGGWCHEGTTRFNELYRMVGEDRASAQAADMEKELLQYCIAKEYGNSRNHDDATNDDGGETNASSTLLNNLQPPVEAYWDEV